MTTKDTTDSEFIPHEGSPAVTEALADVNKRWAEDPLEMLQLLRKNFPKEKPSTEELIESLSVARPAFPTVWRDAQLAEWTKLKELLLSPEPALRRDVYPGGHRSGGPGHDWGCGGEWARVHRHLEDVDGDLHARPGVGRPNRGLLLQLWEPAHHVHRGDQRHCGGWRWVHVPRCTVFFFLSPHSSLRVHNSLFGS